MSSWITGTARPRTATTRRDTPSAPSGFQNELDPETGFFYCGDTESTGSVAGKMRGQFARPDQTTNPETGSQETRCHWILGFENAKVFQMSNLILFRRTFRQRFITFHFFTSASIPLL